LIIIGRRKDLHEKNKYKRRDYGNRMNIKIHTYDWLYERAKERFQMLHRLNNYDSIN